MRPETNVTVEEPDTRVVRPEPESDRPSGRDGDGVSSGRVLQALDNRRVDLGVIGTDVI
jgi:hypothetical protein